MGIFNPVTLHWEDEEYTVPEDHVMGLIAQIEDVITLAELTQSKGAPLARLAMGYGAALRYAGAKVSDEEVYKGMFVKGQGNSTRAALSGLLAMMIPPEDVLEKSPKKKGQKSKQGSKS